MTRCVSVEVAVTMWSVVVRGDARLERLVVRRTVTATGGPGSAGHVEQTWISDAHRTVGSAVSAVRRLCAAARPLVLGAAVPDLPEVAVAAADSLDALARMTQVARASGGRVERLVRVLTRLEATGAGGVAVVRVDVTTAPGSMAAMAARQLGRVATDQLRPLPAAEQPPPDDSSPTGDPPELLLETGQELREREQLWCSLRDAPLEPVADADVPDFAVDSPVVVSSWQRPLEQTWAEQTEQGFDSVVITLIGVDGAQLGDHNKQVNLWRYHLEPDIDLAAALRDERVQRAFTEYALQPDSADLRREAVAALEAVRTGDGTDWAVTEHQAVVTHGVGGPAALLPGTIVLNDCRGIQVGNHLHQSNTFSYVCAPSVEAHDLLRRNPALVEAVVDHACRPDVRGIGSLERRLSDAVSEIAEHALAHEPGSGLLPARSMTVEGGSGLSIGDRNRQVDTLDVAVDVSRALDDIVERLRLEVERVEELRRLEALEAELEAERLEADRLEAEQAEFEAFRYPAREMTL